MVQEITVERNCLYPKRLRKSTTLSGICQFTPKSFEFIIPFISSLYRGPEELFEILFNKTWNNLSKSYYEINLFFWIILKSKNGNMNPDDATKLLSVDHFLKNHHLNYSHMCAYMECVYGKKWKIVRNLKICHHCVNHSFFNQGLYSHFSIW